LTKNKVSKNWIQKRRKDIFFKKSKIKGYRSRSAFKLIEINNKFKIIKKNSCLLDLGASPGGWSQVAANVINKGKILAIDLKDMEKIETVKFVKIDINEKKFEDKLYKYFNNKIDIIISDMAANTTGDKNLDSYRTGELCLKAMELAKKILNKDGVFLSKVFMGAAFTQVNEKAKKYFKKVIKYKPEASKSKSKELYIYCKGVLNI